jgi:glycosyltransferase involved in cell wall biosynthesis
MADLISVSAVIPTRNRSQVFWHTLQSLAQQSLQPSEMIVVDGSSDDLTQQICLTPIPGLLTQIHYHRATQLGAATQRNQAMSWATQPYILFCDDDILFEPDCLSRLWQALTQDAGLGGVCSLITNCHYQPPGLISRLLFLLLHGRHEQTYAGKCIGPVVNLLPEDRDDLPEVVPVEWMNTTCTLYRRCAMPEVPFPEHFVGYSLMEDVTLSLTVAQHWRLANARLAKIYHDSQPGDHKSDPAVLAKMDLVNRHYVMTQILGRARWQDYGKLLLQQGFSIIVSLQSLVGWQALPKVIAAKWSALQELFQTMPTPY